MTAGLLSRDILCGDMPAHVVFPAGAQGLPVVVLMHERYGLVEHTKDLARRCAADGYVVIAPDFFHRHPDPAALHAGAGHCDMSDSEAIERIDRALAALANEPAADLARVAVAGYCQTGRYPVVYAAQRKIAAAIAWYGAAAPREWPVTERQPVAYEEVIAGLSCRVFGAFGEADHLISLDDVRRFRAALEASRKSYEIHVYAGAPHGWLNDTMPGRYRKAQADAGWAHQQAFLARAFSHADASAVTQHYDCACAASYDFTRNRRLA